MFLRWLSFFLSTLVCFSAHAHEAPLDVLVIAPHPDDEALCCSGVIASAVARGARVHVFVMTSGGGWAVAASHLVGKPAEKLEPADFAALAQARSMESIAAMQHLGLRATDVTFLDYPTELHDAYETPDTHALLVAALARSIGDLHPREVYAPGAADTHPTHGATHSFVRDALSVAHWHGHLFEYVIHSGSFEQWPWPPVATPTAGFEAHDVEGARVPYHVAWPPPVRIELHKDLVTRKLEAIQLYTTQIAVSQTFLESFVKDEEIFWLEEL